MLYMFGNQQYVHAPLRCLRGNEIGDGVRSYNTFQLLLLCFQSAHFLSVCMHKLVQLTRHLGPSLKKLGVLRHAGGKKRHLSEEVLAEYFLGFGLRLGI